MQRVLSIVFLVGLFCIAGNASASGSVIVQNGNNSGEGSLRAAIDSGSNYIRFAQSVSNIIVTESLVYDGTRKLTIIGSGQTIDASGIPRDDDILVISRGVNVSISDLALVGNYNDVNQDPNTPEGGKGIYVDVPLERTGMVKVELNKVSVTRVGSHGIHISDCDLGDACASGSGGGGDGSPASIYAMLNDVHINKVGYGKADADGLRIDDRGEGSIYLNAYNSSFLNVGADGIELDEGNGGSVIAYVDNSIFDGNGEYCNLGTFVAGNPCDDEGDPDVDDGFDIDEAGVGSIFASINNTKVTNNFDEGLDFDEEGSGNIEVALYNFFGSGNSDEAIKYSEEDQGGIDAWAYGMITVDNNGNSEGIEIEEADDGDVSVTVINSNMIGSDDEELKVEQDDDGDGEISVINSTVVLDLDGVIEQ